MTPVGSGPDRRQQIRQAAPSCLPRAAGGLGRQALTADGPIAALHLFDHYHVTECMFSRSTATIASIRLRAILMKGITVAFFSGVW
jgi:hypothetical protein